MDRGVSEAIQIMAVRADILEREGKYTAVVILSHAIRHIARPERDIYPKVRLGDRRHQGKWRPLSTK